MKLNELYDILTESFDNGYPWTHLQHSSDFESYAIDVTDDHEMTVLIQTKNMHMHSLPELSFTSTKMNRTGDMFAMTGVFAKHNVNPIRVLSSVIEIAKRSRLIANSKGFYMHSKSSEASRTSVYRRMLKKFNMKFNEFNSKKIGYVTFEVRL